MMQVINIISNEVVNTNDSKR